MAETKALDPVTATLDDLNKLVQAAANDLPNLKVNRSFFEGDHWQGAAGWIGPRPPDGEPGSETIMAEIARTFVSKNVIAEVIHRHVSGVIGHEPGWTLVPRRVIPDGEDPTPEEQAAIDEGNILLTQWWDARDGHGVLWEVVQRVLYAERSALRLFVPAGQAAAGGDPAASTVQIQAATPFDAIMLIHPDLPTAEQAIVRVDPDTKQRIGILVQQRDNKTSAEVVFLDPVQTQQASGGAEGADLMRPSIIPLTTIRTLGEAAPEATASLPLGGRLTMFEITRDPLVSEQVRQAQRALNLALSMVPRNVITGGFLERVITNAIVPGYTKKNAATGVTEFIPQPHSVGAGKTTYLAGERTTDEITGKETVATPGVHYREPVPVTSSVDAKHSHYEDILDEVDQRHVLMASDATASGVSREQARADFEESLRTTAALVAPLGRWLLETLLAMSEAFLNTPGRWTDVLRVEFRTHINTGPLSGEEQRLNNESVEAGTMSLETNMQRAGITDVDAELQRIAEQDDARLGALERQVNVVKTLFDLGMTLENAGKLVGMSEDALALLRQALENRSQPGDNGGTATVPSAEPGAPPEAAQ